MIPCAVPLNKNKQEFFVSSVWFLWQIISLQTFLSIYLGCFMLINIFHSICVKISINISYFLLILYFFELIFRYLPILLCVLSNNCIQQSYLVNFSRKPSSTQLYFLKKYCFLNTFLQVVLTTKCHQWLQSAIPNYNNMKKFQGESVLGWFKALKRV